MNVTTCALSATLLVWLMTGCSAPATPAGGEATPPAAQQANDPGQPEEAVHEEPGVRTDLDPLSLGDYTVTAWHIGPPTDGHFNFQVAGGEVAAVRAWLGDEAATGAFIGKAEWEETHYCSNLEVGETLPANARVWVEVETPEGDTLKGSVPLKE